MAAAAYLGGPVSGKLIIYPRDKELMTSPSLSDIGDSERLCSIPWYVIMWYNSVAETDR